MVGLGKCTSSQTRDPGTVLLCLLFEDVSLACLRRRETTIAQGRLDGLVPMQAVGELHCRSLCVANERPHSPDSNRRFFLTSRRACEASIQFHP